MFDRYCPRALDSVPRNALTPIQPKSHTQGGLRRAQSQHDDSRDALAPELSLNKKLIDLSQPIPLPEGLGIHEGAARTPSQPLAERSSRKRHASNTALSPPSPTPGHLETKRRFRLASPPVEATPERPPSVSPRAEDMSRLVRHGQACATCATCL